MKFLTISKQLATSSLSLTSFMELKKNIGLPRYYDREFRSNSNYKEIIVKLLEELSPLFEEVYINLFNSGGNYLNNCVSMYEVQQPIGKRLYVSRYDLGALYLLNVYNYSLDDGISKNDSNTIIDTKSVKHFIKKLENVRYILNLMLYLKQDHIRKNKFKYNQLLNSYFTIYKEELNSIPINLNETENHLLETELYLESVVKLLTSPLYVEFENPDILEKITNTKSELKVILKNTLDIPKSTFVDYYTNSILNTIVNYLDTNKGVYNSLMDKLNTINNALTKQKEVSLYFFENNLTMNLTEVQKELNLTSINTILNGVEELLDVVSDNYIYYHFKEREKIHKVYLDYSSLKKLAENIETKIHGGL